MENQIITQEKRKNGLGVAGFVVSLVGAVFFWIPVFGVILLIIGLLLSIAGFIVALSAKRKIGLSIAGLSISTVFIIAVVLFTYVFLTSFPINNIFWNNDKYELEEFSEDWINELEDMADELEEFEDNEYTTTDQELEDALEELTRELDGALEELEEEE